MLRSHLNRLFICVGVLNAVAYSPSAVHADGQLVQRDPEETVRRAEAAQTQLLKELIDTAEDPKRSADDRFWAIQLIGRTGRTEAYAYLIDHVCFRLRSSLQTEAGDDKPCRDALLDASSDWKVGQGILDAINERYGDDELVELTRILWASLGLDVAKRAVQVELDKDAKGRRKHNLEKIKEWLPLR